MKRVLLSLTLLVVFGLSAMSQAVVYSDNFDSYTAGDQLAAQNNVNWTTWSNSPGSAEDPYITTDQSISSPNSVVIEGTNDCVLLLGDKTQGKYNLKFNMFIPNGYLGYFNVLHLFAGASSEWGLQVYFDQGGLGLVDGGGAGAGAFTFSYDQWINLKVFVDLDEDWCDFYVNNTLVIGYQWSLGTFGTPGLNQLGAANFYAWNEGADPKYYIENVVYEAITSSLITEDFEGYTVGQQLVVQAVAQGIDYWTTWSGNPGTTEDPNISAEQTHAGGKSVVCQGVNDFVMLLGDKTAGKYSVDFYLYIPTGKVGYYNLLQAFGPGGANTTWGLEIYYNPGGIAEVSADGTAGVAVFNYAYDQWIHMENIIDLNNDEATLIADGVEILTWTWSNGASGGGINALAGMDIYAATTNGTPYFFVDDINYIMLEPPSGDPIIVVTPEEINFEVVFPNSESSALNVSNTGVTDLDYNVAIIYNESSFTGYDKFLSATITDSFDPITKMDGDGNQMFGTDAITCPAGSLISQPATEFATAYTADEDPGYTAFQSFEDAGFISGLRFWVVDFYYDGTNWVGCEGGDPRTFNIGFYADNGGRPGYEIFMEQFSVNRVNTGELFSGFPIYEYTINFTAPVLLVDGWFSVQGNTSSTNCWTMVINQPGGAGTCMQYNGVVFSPQDEPMGFCLVGESYESWLSVSPDMGTVTPGNAENVTVMCNTENLPNPTGIDLYYATIIINSNDPANPSVLIPVTLEVSGSIILDPPTNLESEVIGNDVSLTWTAPGGVAPAFNEDFEGTFPPTGWLKLNPDGGTGWEPLAVGTTPLPGWTGGEATACPDGGSFQAYCTWTTGGASSNDQWLVTPQLTVGANSVLEFYMIYYMSSYSDHVEIRISTTSQNQISAFNVVVDAIDFNASSSVDWQLYSYDLTDFVDPGTDIYIAFRENVADNINDGSAIAIDNVYVGAPMMRAEPIVPVQQNTTVYKNQIDKDFNYIHVPNVHIVAERGLLGYNVYRNNFKINANLVTATEYLDSDLWGGTYTYYVTAVYDEGESGPSNTVTEVIVGIDETSNSNISIYPNPANGLVNIESPSTINSVRMMNYTGQMVYQSTTPVNQVRISTADMPAGVYFLMIETGEGMVSQKLVVK